MNGVVQFSAFRKLPASRTAKQEALDAFAFFDALQNHVHPEDVLRGDDPPDFVIILDGQKISVELTQLNPAPFGKYGYTRTAEFKRWRSEVKTDPSDSRRFSWGRFLLADFVAAFRSQVSAKAAKAVRYSRNFDEAWLLLRTESGSPASGLVERKFDAKHGHSEHLLNFAAKYLFEMNAVCQTAFPFACVILFTGPKLMAFGRGAKSHNLPGPDREFLNRGAKVPGSLLDGRAELLTASCRSGDVVFWTDLIRIYENRAKVTNDS